MAACWRRGAILLLAAGAQAVPCVRAEPSVANPDIPAPDVLVYPDGDRVTGRLLRREDGMLVFKSLHFGELRVAATDAKIILAPALAVAPAGTVVKAGSATAKKPSAEGAPDELTRYLREIFGDWHGRFSMSLQTLRNTSQTTDMAVEAKLNRKWTNDELHLTSTYAYSSTNNVVGTDLLKANADWRHTLSPLVFTVYQPSLEWNRDYTLDGVPANYVLLQQEIGAGVNVWNTTDRKVRVGVAENFFDNWDVSQGGHTGEHIESLFAEADAKMPWRILITERAIFYYAFATGQDGWENQFEVTKKLTDTLSLGVRHEVRYNDPDVRAQSYSLLRFLLGFDF